MRTVAAGSRFRGEERFHHQAKASTICTEHVSTIVPPSLDPMTKRILIVFIAAVVDTWAADNQEVFKGKPLFT